MHSASASTSPSTLSIFLRASSLAVIEYPVCGGSMNTRSKCSNHDSWLSVTVYGGGGIEPSSRMTTRFGPSAPRCSQIEAEPGPPLNTKHTGRVAGGAPSRKYDVVKTAASGSSRLSSTPPAVTGTKAAIALYFSVRPFETMLP